MTFTRHLAFEGTFNFRDVGRYRTGDGRMLREGMLYRSGALHHVTPHDAQFAIDSLGIRTIFDLRHRGEISAAGGLGPLADDDQVDRVSLEIVPFERINKSLTEELDAAHGRGPSGGRYFAYLDFAQAPFVELFERLARPETYPVVVHCVAGKDRTGVLIAMILDSLGVNRETIIDDYALSNVSTVELLEHLQNAGRFEGDIPASEFRLLGAPLEAVTGFLDRVHEKYGSSRGYLESIGVGAEAFESLEAALLRPDGDN